MIFPSKSLNSSKYTTFCSKSQHFFSKIHRNPDESSLRVFLREAPRFWPKLKSRLLEDYLIFFIQICFKTKIWIYSIDSARLRHFLSYFQNHVIIPIPYFLTQMEFGEPPQHKSITKTYLATCFRRSQAPATPPSSICFIFCVCKLQVSHYRYFRLSWQMICAEW